MVLCAGGRSALSDRRQPHEASRRRLHPRSTQHSPCLLAGQRKARPHADRLRPRRQDGGVLPRHRDSQSTRPGRRILPSLRDGAHWSFALLRIALREESPLTAKNLLSRPALRQSTTSRHVFASRHRFSASGKSSAMCQSRIRLHGMFRARARRDGLPKISRFVSGHDFSRAARAQNKRGASAPEDLLLCLFRPTKRLSSFMPAPCAPPSPSPYAAQPPARLSDEIPSPPCPGN